MRDCKGKFCNTHGMRRTKLYRVWCSMKERCNNTNNKSYKHYGLRGIKVCEEWAGDFKCFYDWAIANGYQEGLTIDRINVDGNYEPSNCRWVDVKTQNRNYGRNHFVDYNGRKYCVVELAEMYGIPYRRLLYRIKNGMDIEKALTKGDMRYGTE